MAIPRIYTAVYSGVPVFEMVVNDIAIMRRRVDSHMNATQILKAAGIDKGKRTKILEREILPGEHEKVQGGYGKFQGTWIPLQRSIDLAKQYQVYELVKPMMEFDPATSGDIDEKHKVPTKEQAQLYDKQAQPNKKKRKLVQSSSSAPAPSPYQQQQPALQPRQYEQDQHHKQSHYWHPDNDPHASKQSYVTPDDSLNDNSANTKNSTILMSIFLSDNSTSVGDLLKATPDIDVNMVLDEQGNTALHWAASLGRFNTVEQLTLHGGDIKRQNYTGETALMKSVAVTNNFDRDCFRRILKFLEGSLHLTDHKHRNVIHHTAITTGVHGREMAALYYMHHLLERLDKTSSNKSALLDAQDDQGDTAINIAARLDCSKMVDLLAEAGANQSTENNLGFTPKDYVAGENKSSPQNSIVNNEPNSPSQHASSSTTAHPTLYSKRSTSSTHRGKEIVATVQKIVDALDEEYGDQLSNRETQLKELQQKLEETNVKLEEAKKDLETRQEEHQHLAEAQQKVRHLTQALEDGWHELGQLTDKVDRNIVLQLDQDIDLSFNIQDEDDHVMKLKARIDAYTRNNDTLKIYADKLRAETAEKEMQCKRLIAACCNLPIDKIDELVEPLTLAIESDPPDLDLGRVIGFMEKIRRQGTFPDAGANADISPISTTTLPSSNIKLPS
ncbi:hypothetical protein BC941DRAFT_402390 [Chlamydoabsidia padenii]|nr:hypothetical protein BC941DRAFT_402390 [Chlamydoabsidia padenii]